MLGLTTPEDSESCMDPVLFENQSAKHSSPSQMPRASYDIDCDSRSLAQKALASSAELLRDLDSFLAASSDNSHETGRKSY